MRGTDWGPRCDILHPTLKTKCILDRGHITKLHKDRQKHRWTNPQIETTSNLLVALFKMAAERIDYR